MKPSIIFGVLFVLFFAALAWTSETQNQKAAYWFDKGVKAKDAQTKIDAYTKAIKADPQFVEALYNLGIVYKKLQNYPLAEEFLNRASKAKNSNINAEARLQIFYELAMTYENLGRYRESESTLVQAKELAASLNVKSRIMVSLGRVLLKQKQYDKALAELREGQKLDASRRDEYLQLIRSVQLAVQAEQLSEEADKLYVQAERARTKGDLAKAKTLFEQIRAMSPGYRDVAIKIVAIDSQLQVNTKKVALTSLYNQARKHETDGSLQLAATIYKDILTESGNFKDSAQRLASVNQAIDKKRVGEIAGSEYAAGMAALRSKNWVRAIFAFEKVVELDRNYRDVGRRLRQAQRGLDSETSDAVITRYYTEGLAAMKRQDFVSAFTAFKNVKKMNSNYRNVESLLSEIEDTLTKNATAATTGGSNEARVDSLRRTAEAAIAQEDWAQAVASLELLRALVPGDTEIIEKLMHVQARLVELNKNVVAVESAQDYNRFIAVGGMVAALLLLPVVSIFIFSPTARARVHLLRGNYFAAAAVYEKMLTRNPGRVKLYAALANIYVLSGRKDDEAVKIYKTVLQLDLPVQDRERIQSMMAQQYVAGGTADNDAIDVLEKELRKEFARKEQNEA